MIEVKVFQANNGDCIWLRYGEDVHTNIIIDVGYLSTFKNSFKVILEECVKNNEVIDLLIITHTDRDHISGLKAVYRNLQYVPLIKEIWINTPHLLPPAFSDNNISYKDGNNAYDFFQKHHVNMRTCIHNEQVPTSLNGATIQIIAPNITSLNSCNQDWEKSNLISGRLKDWPEAIATLSQKNSQQDESITNSASIAILLDYNDRRLLFLGDSTPYIVAQKLEDMGYSKDSPLKLDLIKLAHHGSCHNISNELLEKLECYNYLISSNGSNLSKETLAKIIVKNPNSAFYFNYLANMYDGLFTKEEQMQYDFNCIYPNSDVNYAYIRF